MDRSLLRLIRAIACATILLGSIISGTGVAGAVVKNPDKLCEGHDGVDIVGDDYVLCNDGTVFP